MDSTAAAQWEAGTDRPAFNPMIVIGALFFIFGFITWVSAVLIPYLQIACELNNFQSYLVAFAFYISYFVMAIPSGRLLKLTGYKKGISIGLLLVAFGSLVFIPAALQRQYSLFLTGLFVQGAGLTLLQTAANPYVTILGPIESGARRMSMMGICNGVAGILAPIILGSVILEHADDLELQMKGMAVEAKQAALNQLAAKVILPYLIITAILVLLAVFIGQLKLPEPDPAITDEPVSADREEATGIWQFPHLLIGAGVLFLYVGVEVIAGNTIVRYASWQHIPLSSAKFFSSLTLTGMLIGYLIGIVCIPRWVSQRNALRYCAIVGIAFVCCALFTNGTVSVVFVALLGLSNSLMFPAIWPLAIDGLGKFTKAGSALLVMAISGGAILPLAYGWLADHFDPRHAYILVIPCYAAIGYYALAGYRVGRKKPPRKAASYM
ncbi:MAG TPA: sugar MFS transporter [Puia sp.]|nr:sugar MFS transporter [Puia sp.]